MAPLPKYMGDILSPGLSNMSTLSTCDTLSVSVPADGRVHVVPLPVKSIGAYAGDSLKFDFEIKLPKEKEKPKPQPPTPRQEKNTQTSLLGQVFTGPRRFPDSVYFREIECAGLSQFFTRQECSSIIEVAEAQGFTRNAQLGQSQLYWTDIMDPCLCQGIWSVCGLGDFLGSFRVDGLVPCGLNDVIRIQKYIPGDFSGRHTDTPVRRKDGRVSKYSLRVFLAGMVEGSFEGGLSAFHLGRRIRPAIFEPELGLGLLYRQGETCAVQEETQVLSGCKYVLRADVLFCPPEDLHRYR